MSINLYCRPGKLFVCCFLPKLRRTWDFNKRIDHTVTKFCFWQISQSLHLYIVDTIVYIVDTIVYIVDIVYTKFVCLRYCLL